MSVTDLDLDRLIRSPEGLYFERKSLFVGADRGTTPRPRREVRDQVAEVVAAFANQDGGVLVLGVEDDGELSGHKYPAKAVDEILAAPRTRLTPPQKPGVRATVGGHELLVFEVETSPVAVMLQGDGYPVRVGDSVVRMEAQKIAAWKERGLVESWEARRSELRLADLDAVLLGKAASAASLRDSSAESYLLYRRLADRRGSELVLRKAAELLFARESHAIDHPNAGARLFRVIGTERRFGAQHNVEELPRFEGRVPGVIEAVFTKVQGLLRRPKRLRGLRFEEVPEYPTFAWQEAVVNAMAHRDYGMAGRGVELWLYDDRLEVTSPGGLVADVPIESLHRRDRVHMSRNPRLVRGLVDLGLMREQGEGIPRMFAEMEVQFLAPPELHSSPVEFTVTLRNAPTLSQSDAEWLGALQSEELTDPQARAMALARMRGQVTNAALRDATGLDTLAASRELRTLCERDLLLMQGAGSASFYVPGRRAVALGGGRDPVGQEAPSGAKDPLDRPNLRTDRPNLSSDRPNLDTDRPNLEERRRVFPLWGEMPAELQNAIESLGKRPRERELRETILRLCEWRPLSASELGEVLGVQQHNLTKRHLGPMAATGSLIHTHPDTPNHPEQAYRAAQGSLATGD